MSIGARVEATGPAADLAESLPAEPPLLSVGIVVYGSDLDLLERTLDSLEAALGALPRAGGTACPVFVVDNGPPEYSSRLAARLAARGPWPVVLSGHGNVGYGRGNNLAIDRSRARYHLVLNPDVELAPDALANGLAHLERHPEVGLVAASAFGPGGQALRLCKRRPSVAVLALRAMPRRHVPRAALPLLERYDVAPSPDGCTDVTGQLVSGSFMLCRRALLQAVGGFDPGYFLYFEDFDLSLRLGRVARVLWARDVRIVHHGGSASRKGWLHRRLFVRSAATFFSRHGWRLW